MKKIIISISALLAIFAILFVLYRNKTVIDQNKVLKSNFANGVAVSTDKVVRKEMDNKIILVGSTIPVREAAIPTQAGGEITSLNFQLGSRVGQGALLAKIDDRLKVLAVANAKNTVSKFETDYNKMKNMFDRNAATETQLREIKYAYESAKIQLDQAQKQLEDCKVKAPFGGIVSQKMVELGSYANVGAPVCYLVDMSGLKVSLNVSENDVYQLKEGKKVRVTSSIYPTAEFKGTITYISPKSDKGHSYPIEVTIENRKDYQLKSGSFASVEIDFDNKRSPIVIPRQALLGSVNDAKVYTIQNGVAVAKSVKIGAEYDKYLEILDGLNEGEEIVTSGQVNLEDKMQVRVINN